MNDSLKQRKGVRTSKNRSRKKPPENNYARDLYYMTEALKNVVGIITQSVIVGTALVLVAVGIANSIYWLG